MVEVVSERERVAALSHHEQMLDAQAGCLPCKLCGGKAVITDAGTGAGYYIRCENRRTFHDSKGCLIDDRRLGGWAYNVRDWWNRLHAAPAADAILSTLRAGGEVREAGLTDGCIEQMARDAARAVCNRNGGPTINGNIQSAARAGAREALLAARAALAPAAGGE